jgi:hypothetical protein
VIALKNDKPVNLRSGPGTEYGVIAKVPVGTIVTVLTEHDGWDFINVSTTAQQGYMASQYLRPCDPQPEPAPEPGPEPVTDWLESPTMISEGGSIISLAGKWRVAYD